MLNYSVYLSDRLGRDYRILSQLFCAREGLTIEKYSNYPGGCNFLTAFRVTHESTHAHA